MNCEKCGEVCQCPMEPPSSPSPNEGPTSDAPVAASLLTSGLESPLLAKLPGKGTLSDEEWRHELSERLNRYRSRRKAPPPRYPSLRLPFGPAAPVLSSTPPKETAIHSLEADADDTDVLDTVEIEHSAPEPARVPALSESPRRASRASRSSAKIIEFPRFDWGPPSPPADQLAEPVMDRPRILEVPEVAPPPPALGGITIEPARLEEPEKRPGIDIPLQSAPISRRMLAAAIDGIVIAAACALFGTIFWKVTQVEPPRIQALGIAGGIACLCWAVYQYLMIVYAGTTPGLRLSRLQLSRFDGSTTSRSLRRWRVFASFLSAASLGMGYAWLFLDEDGLCWHDRITRTYLAPRRRDRARA